MAGKLRRLASAWIYVHFVRVVFATSPFTSVFPNESVPLPPAFQARIPDSTGGFPCLCGIPDPSDRIVGGVVAPRGRFPWLVALVKASNVTAVYCGGVLITARHVLTAYHCTKNMTMSQFRIRVGVYDFLTPSGEPGSRTVQIFRKIEHSQKVDYADIAVLVLFKRLSCGPTVRPICLPRQGRDFEGVDAVVAGWGSTRFEGPVSRYPLSAHVPVVNTAHCQKDLNMAFTKIRQDELCAGTTNGTVDACRGDSGGPLMYMNKTVQRWEVIGLVSFGIRCATKGFYGVYTNVSCYTDWAVKATRGNATVLNP